MWGGGGGGGRGGGGGGYIITLKQITEVFAKAGGRT